MRVLDTKPALTTSSSVFDLGKWKPNSINVRKSSPSNPPFPLYIVAPDLPPGDAQTKFPVILFLHGFLIPNTSYSQLLKHISSHGYIAVAPGRTLFGYLRSMCVCSAVEDVDCLAEVADWIKTDLYSVLPSNVQPDLSNVALAGHSKGGKAAFALALGYAQTTLNFTALIGLDPVAGPSPASLVDPKLLTYIPRTFNISMPVAVIGTGLGNDSVCCIPPAAPFGCNHPEFFKASKPPSCYFLANDYGHMDMLNNVMARLSSLIMASGNGSRDKLRSGLGGIIVAFLMAYNPNNPDSEYLEAIVSSPGIAPIRLDPVLWVEE